MSNTTTIEWTDATWNPVTGCTKISPGCDHCYAERFSERFRGTPGHPFEHGFDLTLRPERLDQPLRWRQPRMIFVNSMSDLFHKDVPKEFISRVCDTMEHAHWHIFQVLTKRSSLMRDFLRCRYGDGRAPSHMWFGVSVEDGQRKSRIRHLQEAPAGVRFLSVEPLIGPVGKLDLTDIDWVILGGKSGPGARPMKPEWVREVRDQCKQRGVAFFFKQWGGLRPKSGGRTIDGREWNQFPEARPMM
jgi:protein gp37